MHNTSVGYQNTMAAIRKGNWGSVFLTQVSMSSPNFPCSLLTVFLYVLLTCYYGHSSICFHFIITYPTSIICYLNLEHCKRQTKTSADILRQVYILNSTLNLNVLQCFILTHFKSTSQRYKHFCQEHWRTQVLQAGIELSVYSIALLSVETVLLSSGRPLVKSWVCPFCGLISDGQDCDS